MLTPNTSDGEGTFFSQERFVRAVALAEAANVRVLKLQVPNSPAHLFGLERVHRFNRRSISLAPFGLYASPAGAHGSYDCISALLQQLKTFRTVAFDWNVRFDHGELADRLEKCGLARHENTTQVLYLDRPYDALFRGFSETTRNQIRSAERKGVVVRRATKYSDVAGYYGLYEKMTTERKWTSRYQFNLSEKFFDLKDDIILLLAELDEHLIGGGWYICDGISVFYWQSAIDHKYSKYFPMYAIMNSAIRLAWEGSMAHFNMGGSANIPSLEQFKSFWGAQKLPVWSFVWRNPIWSLASRILRRTI